MRRNSLTTTDDLTNLWRATIDKLFSCCQWRN